MGVYGEGLEVLHEDVPDGDDVADAAGEDEEMEDGVHVAAFVQTVEQSAGDVADALGNDPYHGGGAHTGQQGLEGDEDGEAHEDETQGLDVAVVFQTYEAHGGAGDGGKPHEAEQYPSPHTVVAHGDEGDGGVAAGNVPVDGGVVETAQHFLGLQTTGQGVVDGGGDVGGEHAEEVEDDTGARPSVAGTEAPYQKDDADDDAQQDAGTVGAAVDDFFFLGVFDHRCGAARLMNN